MAEKQIEQHGERITAVESQVEALATDLHNLANIVRSGHEALTREIRELATQISKRAETNWPVWIAAATLILAIGGAALTPIWFRIGSVESLARGNEITLSQHQQLAIHPVAAQRLEGFEKYLETVREINRIKLEHIEKIDALERARIMEITDLKDKAAAERDATATEHNKERIDALEKLLQPIPRLEQKVEVLETKIGDAKKP